MNDFPKRIFEWDPKKDEINFRKHGIHFEDVLEVFDDPFAITVQDRIENGEERWRTIGALPNFSLVLIAHTTVIGEVEVVRIISARKLDRKERYMYEYG